MTAMPLTGDITLTARPATGEAFLPFGRLLERGGRARLGRRGSVLVALDVREPGPRRVTHVQRYPEARRLLLPVGESPLLLVLLPPGDPAPGPPAAFLVPSDRGVVIDAGVWHAGPILLREAALLELLETRGPVDRMDRRPLREVAGIEGAHVALADEPGAPAVGLDLEATGAVLLDAQVAGRLRLGLLLVEGVEIGPVATALDAEARDLASHLRGGWGRVQDVGQVPSVAAARALWADLGLDPAVVPTPHEVLARRVLEGRPFERASALAACLALAMLRRNAVLHAFDASLLGDRIRVRTAGEGETVLREGRRMALAGQPVLVDRRGVVGAPVGPADWARPTPATRRLLVVLFLPAGTADEAADAQIDEVAALIGTHLAGRATQRLLVGGNPTRSS
jgi:DNA/RNA-binding domain of Phe-tRNA-synthetase-like protein/ureidoglycolate hydrolase